MLSSSSSQGAAWTTRSLLDWTSRHLDRKGFEHPRLTSEMLLAHVLGVERIKLYLDLDRPASDLERAAYRELIERAARHEPVDYLIGKAPFFSMLLKVDRRVLVPRPSTEALVEHVIQHARRTPGFASPLIADIATGSGAIAIALARHIPGCRVIATDLSADALALAKENAAEQNVADRIDFLEGDLLAPLEGVRVRYLVSNPPYISDAEWAEVPPNVKDHEPMDALRGGTDGLKYLRTLIERGHGHLDAPAQLVLEIAASQKQAVLDLMERAPGLTNPHVLVDHERLPRVAVADAANGASERSDPLSS